MAFWVLGSTIYHTIILGLPSAELMGGIAVLALAANLASVLMLMRYKDGDANVRSVWLCSRNDAIGNVVVMIAAAGVWGTGTAWPDLGVAALMAGIFATSSVQILRQAWAEYRDGRYSASPRGGVGLHGACTRHHDGHDHDHAGHDHAMADLTIRGRTAMFTRPASFGKAFAIGIALNAGFVVLEVVYGLLSNSVALIGRRRPQHERRFGPRRRLVGRRALEARANTTLYLRPRRHIDPGRARSMRPSCS